MQENNSGSFINGFGIGILTGLAAYFLFGTEQGRDLKKKIITEWDTVEGTLKKEAGIEPPKQFKQVMTSMLKHFAETVSEIQEIEEKSGKKISAGRTKSEAKPKTNPRFKGL